MTKRFQGFDEDAVGILRDLPAYAERDYQKVKGLLANGLRAPGIALIQDVAEAMGVGLTVEPRASVSPFHRDLRFAKTGTPRYKDHLMLTAWTGRNKKVAPTLWIRMDADSIGFASGIGFTPEIRSRFREAVAGRAGVALEKALGAIVKKHEKHDVDVAGDQLKKVPAPFPQDHPRADLLRRNGLQVRFKVPLPKSVAKPALADACVKHLSELLPVHQWLVKHVG